MASRRPRRPPPDDQGPVDGLFLFVEEFQSVGKLCVFANEINEVSRFEGVFPRGDDQAVFSDDGRNQKFPLARDGGKVDQLHPGQLGPFIQPDAHEFHAAFQQFSDVHGPRNGHEKVDGLDHFDLGVDDRVDMGGACAQGLVKVIEIDVPYAGELFGCGRDEVGGHAGHQVDLVAVGDR